jgi:hypothetical protein
MALRHISAIIAGDFCPDGFTQATPDELATMPYADYLCTEHWQQRRRIVLRYKPNCERCLRPATDVHHITYERRGREKPSDLMALCRDCHRAVHGIESD